MPNSDRIEYSGPHGKDDGNDEPLDGWRTTGNWVVEKDGVVTLKPRAGEEWTKRRHGDTLEEVTV